MKDRKMEFAIMLRKLTMPALALSAPRGAAGQGWYGADGKHFSALHLSVF